MSHDDARLRLHVQDEGDGTAMVSAFVRSNEFMGRGEAPFELAELARFARELGELALTRSGVAETAGGPHDGGRRLRTMLSLRAGVADRLGHLLLRVEAATPFQPGDPSLGEDRVAVHLEVDGADIAAFAARLAATVPGGGSVALA